MSLDPAQLAYTLEVLEQGERLMALSRELGVGVEEAAEKLGISRSQAYNLQRLMSLEPHILAALRQGDLKLSAAFHIAAVRDPSRRQRAFSYAVGHSQNGQNARGLARGIRRIAAGENVSSFSSAPSTAEREAIEARAIIAPLTVTGISDGEPSIIEPARFHLLAVDPSYQRGDTSEVAEIVRALQAGGAMLVPVHLCTRPWADDKEKLWIVDGHQRVSALRRVNRPIPAMIHRSESVDAEKRFFSVLQTRRNLVGDGIVKAWVGPSSALLVRTQQPGHPLHEHIAFGVRGRDRISSAALISGALAAAEGIKPIGQIQRVLRRLDAALADAMKRALAEQYLRLIGLVYPDGRAPAKPVLVALGIAANARWRGGDVAMPSPGRLTRLGAIKWDTEVPALTSKYFPVVMDLIERIWKT